MVFCVIGAGTLSSERNVGGLTEMAGASFHPAVGFPVEVLPEDVDAIDDAAELEGAVRGVPQLVERGELSEVAEAILGRLSHGHLVGHEAAVPLAGMDPEAFRRFLREESRLLAQGERTEKEACGEADRARAGRDEL